MVTCTRLFGIDVGHRVTGHESKCRNVHGHRYSIEVTAHGDLDEVGRVIDFGCLKKVVGTWLDDSLDHGYAHHPDDEVGLFLREQGQKTYQMPDDLKEPTAENLAALILREASRLLDGCGVTLTQVRVWETPNCYADAF